MVSRVSSQRMVIWLLRYDCNVCGLLTVSGGMGQEMGEKKSGYGTTGRMTTEYDF